MSKQRVSIGVLAAALLVSSPLVAQTESSELVRTPWDAPDLRGVWDFRTITPLERPEEFGEREQLSHDEAAEFEERTLAVRNKDRRASDGLSAQADVANAYNQFWWDYGDKLTDDRRTSLIVDPPDGRIPELTDAAKGRIAERTAARRRPAHGPEDRGVAERCILGFNAGPPMSPSAYNNNVQIFQTEHTVVLLVEMVHDSRIVPLDGRAPLPEDVRQWRGDSRGHWEGDTLVVVTTNFTDQTSFRGSGPNMRLTERFTRAGEDRLVYEYTIEDLESFSRPWTAVVPMTRNPLPMFEYACHEGNYGMYNLLSGARAEDAETAARAAETSGGAVHAPDDGRTDWFTVARIAPLGLTPAEARQAIP